MRPRVIATFDNGVSKDEEERNKARIEQIQSDIQRMKESRPEIEVEEEEKIDNETRQQNATDTRFPTQNQETTNKKNLHGSKVSDVHFESD